MQSFFGKCKSFASEHKGIMKHKFTPSSGYVNCPCWHNKCQQCEESLLHAKRLSSLNRDHLHIIIYELNLQ